MTEEKKQALIDEIVIQALRDDVRQWKQRAEAAEAKLAELVPDEMTKSLASIANEYQTSPQNALFIVVGWNACRAAIMRNIEEAKLATKNIPATSILSL